MKISFSAFLIFAAGNVNAATGDNTIAVNAADDASTRIVNGEDARVGRFPYYVSLYRNGIVKKSNFVCGASLIAPDMLLTAAHCEQPNFRVVVGNSKITGEGTVRDVVQKFRHEDYQSRSIRNDIMLLKLDSPVVDEKPVILNFDENLPPQQEELVTLGLGQLAENDRDLPEVLQSVKLPEYPFPDCEVVYVPQLGGFFQEIFENFFLNMEESKQICAGGVDGKGSCYGDSGGPLVLAPEGAGADGYDGSDDIQLGLTSFGRICGSENPGVFTRVSGYEYWIKDRVCKYSDSPPDYCDGYESPEGGDGNGGDDGGDVGGGGGGSFFCFSSEDTVEIERGGTISMRDLKIGDSILVEPNTYEQVYSFGHRSDSIKAEFLSIKTSNGAKLEVTKDHLVFVEGGMSIPASDLDQEMKLVHNDRLVGIQSIDTVIRGGMYAPFTPSGKLIVNGFQASSFVAINGSATIKVMGINLHYQMISKLFESPRRLVCQYVYGTCDEESYNEKTGISTWHGIALESYQWLLHQNTMIFHLGFFLALSTVGLMSAFESIMASSSFTFLPLIALAATILVSKRLSISSIKKVVK